jgi:hypothetical protein
MGVKMVYKVDYTLWVVELWDYMLLCACAKKYQSKILVLEKECYHMVRTKNAGFACLEVFQIIDDLNHIQRRSLSASYKTVGGLRLLKRLGDEAIDFKPYGGYNYF